MPVSAVISALARSFLAGDPAIEQVQARAVRTLGRRWRWLRPLAIRYFERFAGSTRPRHRDVVQFLLKDSGFRQAWRKYRHEITIAEWIAEPQRMQPVDAARNWGIPIIGSAGELARWLSITIDELDWFADLKALGNKLRNPKLQHYWYRVLPKRSGGFRMLEIPKTRLKEFQRRILAEILDRVPVHPSAHGFVKGRSIVTFAAPHTGKRLVLWLDLLDFFPASPAARAQALFRTLGYPESVADLLGGICTNAVPRSAWGPHPQDSDVMRWLESKSLYARPHLPQGAPTSPALANLTAFRLDCRLTGLAKSAGAVYTRYADDLAFSGGDEFARSANRFSAQAARLRSKKDSTSIIVRRASCARAFGNSSLELWSTRKPVFAGATGND